MKKSFMTRVLATGLSLAMAFSLSAATNVSVASAAAKPAMKSKTMTVKVGQKKNYQATAATQKAYKITKVKMSAAGKTKAKVTVNSSKKSIKVEGLAATKGSNVVISFKNNKTKKTTTVTTKVVVKATEEAKAIVSAKQTGVKVITVTTNFDASNSKVSVTRGASEVATDKIAFSTDGKTITINTTANIVAAEYKVTVDDLSATVTGEVSKVASIEFLSDKAAAKKQNSSDTVYKQATVGYMVKNQFGDDITKTTTLNISASCGAQASGNNHLITFTSSDTTNGFIMGRDIISCVLLDTATATTASASLSIGTEAYASDLTFEGVYNDEGKELTEDTDLANDTFYALFSAKDQYGNQYKSYKNVLENKDVFLTVVGGMTGLDKVTPAPGGTAFNVVTKDGTDYLAYPLTWNGTITPSNGSATVQLLSSGGATCSGTIEVREGGRVASIEVSASGVVAAGEETELDFTALDAAGNPVTAFKHLNKVDITSGTLPLNWVKKTDGTAKLVLDARGLSLGKNQSSIQTYSFKTLDNKFSMATVTITENARPVAIDGLQGIDSAMSKTTGYTAVKVKNLKIEDQYGRIMTNSQLTAAPAKTGIYKLNTITVSSSDEGIFQVCTDAALTANAQGKPITIASLGAITKDTVLFYIKPVNKGTATLSINITNGATGTDALTDTTANMSFSIKDTSGVDTATVAVKDVHITASTVTNAAFAQNVIVKANGAVLPSTDYFIAPSEDFTPVLASEGGITVWAIEATKTANSYTEFANNTASTLTKQITVTLNGSGESYTQDVVLSKSAPKATVASLKKDSDSVTNGALTIASVITACVEEVKDQYGKAVNLGTLAYADGSACKPVVTYKNITDNASVVTVTNNGTDSAVLNIVDATKFNGATMTIVFGDTSVDVRLVY